MRRNKQWSLFDGFSRTSFGAGLIAVSLVVAGCSSSDNTKPTASGGDPQPGGTLVDLQNFAGGDPDHIDPALASDVPSSQVAELLYDGLTETTVDGSIRNAVAETAQVSDDQKTWTFRLRDGVKFDNNDPVRPSDFKFAWERAALAELKSQVAYHLSPIEGFEAVNGGSDRVLSGVVADDAARTLTVKLTEPRPDFNATVSLPVFSPLPKPVFDAASTQGAPAGGGLYFTWESSVMVGNGPFRMSKPWERSRAVTLARSDTYYGGANNKKAYLDTLEFRISKSVDSAFTDFESNAGQVGRIPSGRFADVKAQRGDDVVNTPLLATEFWAFNMGSANVGGPDNLKYRQAIAALTNKTDLVNKVYGGARTVATSFTPPAMPGYSPTLAQPDRNVESARQLLKDYKKPPPPIKITFPAGLGHEEKASLLQQNLAELGITATPEPLERAAFGQAMRNGTTDIFWRNWTADYVSYDNFVVPNFGTSSSDNLTNYSNPALDAIIKTARAEKDATVRNGLYRDAEKLVLADQVVVPLDWTAAGLVKTPQVRDFKVKPLGYVAYADVWLTR